MRVGLPNEACITLTIPSIKIDLHPFEILLKWLWNLNNTLICCIIKRRI